MEIINHTFLAVCKSESLDLAKKIGLSEKGQRLLMDERYTETRPFFFIATSSLDNAILFTKHVTEEEMLTTKTEGKLTISY